MVSVDKFAGKPTVKGETLDMLAKAPPNINPGGYRQARITDQDALLYNYARGYWLTRYIEETQPALMLDLLQQRYNHNILEKKVTDAYGMDAGTFWLEINGMIGAHFNQQ